jgi:hypothetical protein
MKWTLKKLQRNQDSKSRFFEEINKIDKPLYKLSKRKRKKTQINKIRGKKWDVTTNTNEIQRIIREYFKKLFCNKIENLEKLINF